MRPLGTLVLTLAIALATVAASTTPAAAGPAGWAIQPPGAGTRVVYVSSSQGNDANSGLNPSSPRKTIAAGWKLMRPHHPDRMLLKRGDTWQEGFGQFTKSGKSPEARLVIGNYGDPNQPRPKLRTPRTTFYGVVPGGGYRAHVAITGLDMAPVGYTGEDNHPAGIDLQGTWNDVVIEDYLVQGYANNVMIQGNSERRATDIQVRRCVIVDSFVVGDWPHSQGLMIGHTDGALVEGNVLDHNGWNEEVEGATPTIFRHNVYINPDNTTDITVRGNIVARGAASGLRCAGSVCENNLLLSNPLSIIGAGFTRRIAGNVIIDSHDIGDITPIGKGITGCFSDCEIVDNILAHRTNPGTWNIVGIDIDTGSSNVRCEGNTVYDWAPPGPQEWVSSASAIMCKGDASNISMTDNEFQMPRGGRLLWCEDGQYTPDLSGNTWWSGSHAPFLVPGTGGGTDFAGFQAASGEEGGQYARPAFKNPNRTPGSFAKAFGWGTTLEDYLREVRKMERGRCEGQERFAPAAIRYITQGFGG